MREALRAEWCEALDVTELPCDDDSSWYVAIEPRTEHSIAHRAAPRRAARSSCIVNPVSFSERTFVVHLDLYVDDELVRATSATVEVP